MVFLVRKTIQPNIIPAAILHSVWKPTKAKKAYQRQSTSHFNKLYFL